MTHRSKHKPLLELRAVQRDGNHRHASPEEDPMLMEFLLEAERDLQLSTGAGTHPRQRTAKTAKRALQYTPLTNNWS